MMDRDYWRERANAGTPAEKVGWLDREYDFSCHERRIRNAIRAVVSPGMTLLDIGCGYGRFAAFVTKELHANWIGVDFCGAFRDQWIRSGGHGRFILADATAFQADDPVDVILSVGAVGGLGYSIESFRSRFARDLKPDGVFVITVNPHEIELHWRSV